MDFETSETYLRVPEEIRRRPIDGRRSKPRSGGALASAGLRTLGDLDGLTLAELRRRVGAALADDIRHALLRAGGRVATSPSAPPALAPSPAPPPAAEPPSPQPDIPLARLRLSTRLARLLGELGATHLSHLQRVSPELLETQRGAGLTTVSEYTRLLAAARTGSLELADLRRDAPRGARPPAIDRPAKPAETHDPDAPRPEDVLAAAKATIANEPSWIFASAIADRLVATGLPTDAETIEKLLDGDLEVTRHPLGAYRETTRARDERRALSAAAHAILRDGGPLPGSTLLDAMDRATDWPWSRLTTSVAADVVLSDPRIERDAEGRFRLRNSPSTPGAQRLTRGG